MTTPHKNQPTIDALTGVARIMIELWYGDTTAMTVGEISRAVDRCSEIFQFIQHDETIEVKIIAVLNLCDYYKVRCEWRKE